MVKKKNKERKKATVKKIPVRTDSASVEEQTIARVNRTLTTIENFLAKWDTAKRKPDSIFPEIVKIRKFHEALGSWQKNTLKARARKENDEARIRRLRDFVLLCRTYS